MKKLVTLDAAGTIVDHKWDPGGIAKAAAAECGILVDLETSRARYETVAATFREEQEELEKMGDKGAIASLWQKQMAAWLGEIGDDPSRAPEVLSVFRRIAFGKGSFVWSIYSDVLPAIEALRDCGACIGVISNWDHTLHEVLSNLGVIDKFDFVIASLEFGYEKPDKRIFAEALKRGNAAANEAVHVGDSYYDDFQGARDAGLSALLLDRESQHDYAQGRIASLMQIQEALVCA